jgi:hypothetical protein
MIKIEQNADYESDIPAEDWSYFVLDVTSTQYSMIITANSNASATMVFSPDVMPENNGETTPLFSLDSVYASVSTLTSKASVVTYNYARPGIFYIGFLAGSVDAHVEFRVEFARMSSSRYYRPLPIAHLLIALYSLACASRMPHGLQRY